MNNNEITAFAPTEWLDTGMFRCYLLIQDICCYINWIPWWRVVLQ